MVLASISFKVRDRVSIWVKVKVKVSVTFRPMLRYFGVRVISVSVMVRMCAK